MRTVGEAFAAHLAGRATTLCWCWRLVRRDGAVLGFTDHDRELDFEGTGFSPAAGLDASELVERIGPQVQTAEVLGVISSAALAEDDILLGRYDGARIESWRVNWRNCEERALIRVDTIGEIVREDGIFRAELRSGQHALNRVSGRYYQHVCDARLGDARCGVSLETPDHRVTATVLAVEDERVTLGGIEGFAEGWANHGIARWTSGARAGVTDGIVAQAHGVLRLARSVAAWVAVGDTLDVFAGCDRTFAACRDKFGNGVNFRGFPHIPGNDAVLRYPDAADALDGRPRVR